MSAYRDVVLHAAILCLITQRSSPKRDKERLRARGRLTEALSVLFTLQQASKVCRVDVKPTLREEEISPSVSLKTHAQPVR